jgi:DNA invertase Pin-like site-specific DNA recombinase
LGEDTPVRTIDVFVDELDLAGVGFGGVEPETTGSGKHNSRPQFQAAISHAQGTAAKLLIARLDRLARNLHLVSSLQVRRCGLRGRRHARSNRLTIHIIAALAEPVGRTISENTRPALAAAKARGVKLGNPNGARTLRGVGNTDAVAKINGRDHQLVMVL